MPPKTLALLTLHWFSQEDMFPLSQLSPVTNQNKSTVAPICIVLLAWFKSPILCRQACWHPGENTTLNCPKSHLGKPMIFLKTNVVLNHFGPPLLYWSIFHQTEPPRQRERSWRASRNAVMLQPWLSAAPLEPTALRRSPEHGTTAGRAAAHACVTSRGVSSLICVSVSSIIWGAEPTGWNF